MNTLSRRGFLAASAAAFAAARFPRAALAQATAPLGLSAETRTLDINGRAATVFGLAGPSGQGLVLEPGQRFRVDLTNNLDVGTIIHWHGQVPPNAAALDAGEAARWMLHCHHMPHLETGMMTELSVSA